MDSMTMTDPGSEADARILIDGILRSSGWDPADKTQVLTETAVKVSSRPFRLDDDSSAIYLSGTRPGVDAKADNPAGRTHFADYTLLSQRGRPLAVIEAKRHAIDPYFAKQQALPYAQNLGAPFNE